LTVLQLRPFVIDRIPPWIMGNRRPLPLTYLISKATLQKVRLVEIKLSLGDCEKYASGKIWYLILQDLLRVWAEMNLLIRLKIMIKVNNIDVERLWDRELAGYAAIVMAVSPPLAEPCSTLAGRISRRSLLIPWCFLRRSMHLHFDMAPSQTWSNTSIGLSIATMRIDAGLGVSNITQAYRLCPSGSEQLT
jgi:hypothetical protein